MASEIQNETPEQAREPVEQTPEYKRAHARMMTKVARKKALTIAMSRQPRASQIDGFVPEDTGWLG